MNRVWPLACPCDRHAVGSRKARAKAGPGAGRRGRAGGPDAHSPLTMARIAAAESTRPWPVKRLMPVFFGPATVVS